MTDKNRSAAAALNAGITDADDLATSSDGQSQMVRRLCGSATHGLPMREVLAWTGQAASDRKEPCLGGRLRGGGRSCDMRGLRAARHRSRLIGLVLSACEMRVVTFSRKRPPSLRSPKTSCVFALVALKLVGHPE